MPIKLLLGRMKILVETSGLNLPLEMEMELENEEEEDDAPEDTQKNEVE
jgi:hypothetical protein